MARGRELGNRWSTNRLACGVPVGGAKAGLALTAGGEFLPNVFTGMWPWDTSPPQFNLGAGNFCFEGWYCWKTLDNQPPDFYCQTGFITDVAYPNNRVAVLEFNSGGRSIATYDNDPLAAPGEIQTGWGGALSGWHHIAVNCNRAGNMDLIFDGVVQLSVVINNTPCVLARFVPLSSEQRNIADLDVADPVDHNAPVVVGPIAAHTGLLTAAQLQDSVRGRRVQNLATTLVYYDWRRVEGQAGWEFDQDRMIDAVGWWIRELPVGAPMGAAGTVVVPDLSGNGNDWTLPTLAAYTEVTANKSRVGFLTDPWWYN